MIGIERLICCFGHFGFHCLAVQSIAAQNVVQRCFVDLDLTFILVPSACGQAASKSTNIA
jgi:hypothetical protein